MRRRSLSATELALPALAQGDVNRLALALGPGGDGIGRLLADTAAAQSWAADAYTRRGEVVRATGMRVE